MNCFRTTPRRVKVITGRQPNTRDWSSLERAGRLLIVVLLTGLFVVVASCGGSGTGSSTTGGGTTGDSGGGDDGTTTRPPNAVVPSRSDVWVSEADPTRNFNLDYDQCGNCRESLRLAPAAGGEEKRVYLKYDLSGIPQHVTIVSADLRFQYLGGTGCNTPDNVTIYIYECGRNWTEGQITWNGQPPRKSSIRATGKLEGARFDVYVPFSATVVQEWLDSPSTNFGIVVLCVGGSAFDTCKTMPSHEYSGKGVALELFYTEL